MKIKRLLCIFISLLTVLSAVISAAAFSTDTVVKSAVNIIVAFEGTYNSILPDDNGALSIGLLGWHAVRALDLLKKIAVLNETRAQQLLGEKLYGEIKNSETDWSSRTLDYNEVQAVKALLSTEESRSVQDSLAFEDVKAYILHGMSLGLTDPKALVYFADVENQCGGSGSARVAAEAIKSAGSPEKVTLLHMYNAAKADSVAGSSEARRNRAYELCLKLSFSGGEISLYKTGKYKTDADSGLRIRSGPGLNFSYLGEVIPKGTTVEVTDVNGIWGRVVYSGVAGWICLTYALPVINGTSDASGLRGDADGDGKISAVDARIVLRAAAGLEKVGAETEKLCDINGNGKLDAVDARRILRAAANLEKL